MPENLASGDARRAGSCGRFRRERRCPGRLGGGVQSGAGGGLFWREKGCAPLVLGGAELEAARSWLLAGRGAGLAPHRPA